MNAGPIPGTPRPAPIRFPRDEGAHPDAKTEWWYLNGHLQDEEGHRYGFLQCLFDAPDVVAARYNVKLPEVPGGTELDSALTDVDRYTHSQSRELHLHRPGAPHEGLESGRLDERFPARGGSWHLERTAPDTIHLEAPLKQGHLSLDLQQEKPPLLMGGQGEIPMGPYGRSKYYTIPLFRASGTLEEKGQTHHVEGTTWMDHQWGDMQLFHGYAGWDWLGVQLDSGEQLDMFRFRSPDGASVQESVGVSQPDGRQQTGDDFRLTPTHFWTSEATGVRYPVGWHVEVPARHLSLEVRPALRKQEMVGTWPYVDPRLSVLPTYWEGDTDVSGTENGRPVHGKAYLELVGYATPEGDAAAAARAARERVSAGEVYP